MTLHVLSAAGASRSRFRWLMLAGLAAWLVLWGGACVSTGAADFGGKCAAVYGNYDSCARAVRAALDDPATRAQLEKTPASGAYYHQMLAVAELYRGRIPESMRAFDQSIACQARALTFFFRARHFLREGQNAEAAQDIAAMAALLQAGPEPPQVHYYEFLLALLPGDRHDELWNGGDAAFLASRLDWLRRELERNRKLPPGVLPVFGELPPGRFDAITYGMTRDELYKRLGRPDWTYPVRISTSAMAGLTACAYQLAAEPMVVEFRVSEDSGRVGDIRLFPLADYRRQDGRAAGATWFRPKDAPYVLGCVEAPE